MLRRPSLSSFLASVVRRAHQWIATTKLMGMILSVVNYLFSNPRSPLLMMKKEENVEKNDKNSSSSSITIENKDTSSKVDPPRILSVRFLLSISNFSFTFYIRSISISRKINSRQVYLKTNTHRLLVGIP